LIDFRSDIKDDYIIELGISPIEYDALRGFPRVKFNQYVYQNDTTDNIFIGIAHKHLRKKNRKALYKTFLSLYQCYSITETQRYLSGIKISSIKKYMLRIIIIFNEIIDNDKILRGEILGSIKEEYDKLTNIKRF